MYDIVYKNKIENYKYASQVVSSGLDGITKIDLTMLCAILTNYNKYNSYTFKWNNLTNDQKTISNFYKDNINTLNFILKNKLTSGNINGDTTRGVEYNDLIDGTILFLTATTNQIPYSYDMWTIEYSLKSFERLPVTSGTNADR
jgi:hypothetical protein